MDAAERTLVDALLAQCGDHARPLAAAGHEADVARRCPQGLHQHLQVVCMPACDDDDVRGGVNVKPLQRPRERAEHDLGSREAPWIGELLAVVQHRDGEPGGQRRGGQRPGHVAGPADDGRRHRLDLFDRHETTVGKRRGAMTGDLADQGT